MVSLSLNDSSFRPVITPEHKASSLSMNGSVAVSQHPRIHFITYVYADGATDQSQFYRWHMGESTFTGVLRAWLIQTKI